MKYLNVTNAKILVNFDQVSIRITEMKTADAPIFAIMGFIKWFYAFIHKILILSVNIISRKRPAH